MTIKKIIAYILADEENFTLESRLLISAILVGILASLIGSIVSLIISSSLSVLLIAISLFFSQIVLYYFIRIKRKFKTFIVPIIIVSFIGISLIWILDGGINGSNLFLGFVILILTLVIVSGKNKKYVFSLFIVHIITIYFIQYYKPDLITNFSSESIRWIDSIITAIYSSFFIFIIIKFLHKNYTLEKKKAEENEIKYRALSENSQDIISRFDKSCRFIYINKAGIGFSTLTEEQIVGQTLSHCGIYNKELSSRIEMLIENVFLTKKSQYGQFCFDYNNEKVFYDCRFFPEYNDRNEIISVLSVFRDITILKHSEIKLKELNSDKDLFISILGHDLKEPFNTMLGFLQLLTNNLHNYSVSEIEERISYINDSANNAYELFQDILSWARMQSGKLSYEPQYVNFINICDEVIDNLKLVARNKNIIINYFASENININADKNMFSTVLRNLVLNALKFTNPYGTIKIYAENKNKEIVVTVSDNGVGMDSNSLQKLFNSPKIQSTLGTQSEKGTGLGLLLCKDFVQKHDGKIWAESTLGKGSSFKFSIPANNVSTI
jgi:PAS domain S-box-containing protein